LEQPNGATRRGFSAKSSPALVEKRGKGGSCWKKIPTGELSIDMIADKWIAGANASFARNEIEKRKRRIASRGVTMTVEG